MIMFMHVGARTQVRTHIHILPSPCLTWAPPLHLGGTVLLKRVHEHACSHILSPPHLGDAVLFMLLSAPTWTKDVATKDAEPRVGWSGLSVRLWLLACVQDCGQGCELARLHHAHLTPCYVCLFVCACRACACAAALRASHALKECGQASLRVRA